MAYAFNDDKSKVALEQLINEIILNKHPVGSILMSANNVNPSTYLGGTWVAWGSGRVPVGVNTSETEFNTAEKTGGAKTVTLTENQIPSHNHSDGYASNKAGLSASGSATSTAFLQLASDTVTGAISATARNTGNKGGGQAHNNLQPYITCYMWKRTA